MAPAEKMELLIRANGSGHLPLRGYLVESVGCPLIDNVI
jgi:hypothetical protein